MATLPFGVPPLLGSFADVFLSVADALTSDTFTGYGIGSSPQWGIFQGATPVVVADTVTSLSYRQDWAVADYPVERGGFESYDKVNTPFRIDLVFASGGSEAKRQALLDSIAAIGDTLTLYDVITPEVVYIGVNVESYSYRRQATNGLGLMIVDVKVLEIREEGTTDFKNTKDPSGYAASPAGNVQGQETTTDITVRPLSSGVQ
jgi:hypothetical protein